MDKAVVVISLPSKAAVGRHAIFDCSCAASVTMSDVSEGDHEALYLLEHVTVSLVQISSSAHVLVIRQSVNDL